ncbi:hypothetical protein NPX13_g9193 [Xylaria arbuscula]|uniref:DOMON domain-containing protein n=1 Tax=Xylaria arbuscula TaxID=114810 RepID=A0A9W8N6Z8_9PEZI|nr:hypothetical protein NPX13_g9193 [Xylaria arbuscula]
MHSTISTVLTGLALWSGTTSAVCTGWDQTNRNIDDGSAFSTSQSQVVDNLLCPADSQSSCHFDRKSYDITAERILYNSNIRSLDLPKDEADAIFQLAQDGFNEETPKLRPKWEFKTIKTKVSTESTNILYYDSPILEVKPGLNKSLLWTSFYGYSAGVLSGCTNETLNNMTITAATPYLQKEPRLNNQTVLAGTWGSVAPIDDDDDDSGVSSLKSGALFVWITATMVAAYIF